MHRTLLQSLLAMFVGTVGRFKAILGCVALLQAGIATSHLQAPNPTAGSVHALVDIPETEFTTLRYDLFPEHSVRIKRTQFCDEHVGCVSIAYSESFYVDMILDWLTNWLVKDPTQVT